MLPCSLQMTSMRIQGIHVAVLDAKSSKLSNHYYLYSY